MFNPITRTKQAARRHKSKLVYGAGVVTGVAGAVAVRRLIPVHIIAPIGNETLQHLIDHPEDAVHYVVPANGRMVTLFNDVHLKD